MLRNRKNSDGDYTYLWKHCLKESQAQNLINGFLKIEVKKGLESEEEVEEMEIDDGEDSEVSKYWIYFILFF